jgi:N-acetylglucosamine kinase-like BadF-type ATPase
MNYLLGFECGATKTECALADIEGNILCCKTGGAANPLVFGVDKVTETILNLIEDLKLKVPFEYPDLYSIVVGAAGAGREDDAAKLRNALNEKFIARRINLKSLLVTGDAQIALEGAFPKKPGCILIAGTGSIIYGKDENGNFYRAGGFGRIIGDEGSGYSIGKKALQQLSKYFDGRNKRSKLIDLIEDNYHITSQDNLIAKVHKENFDIASIAKTVIAAAETGDEPAIKILHEESDELLLHINTMINKINIKELPVAFGGSLLTNINYFSNLLKEKIGASFHSVKIVTPMLTPLEGAILLAKEMLNE